MKDGVKQHLCIERLEAMHSTVRFIAAFLALTEGFARMSKEGGKVKGCHVKGVI